MPWGTARPSAWERKSWSLTLTGAGSQAAPGLRKQPTSSFFLLSMLMTGVLLRAQSRRKPEMNSNWALRSAGVVEGRHLELTRRE